MCVCVFACVCGPCVVWGCGGCAWVWVVRAKRDHPSPGWRAIWHHPRTCTSRNARTSTPVRTWPVVRIGRARSRCVYRLAFLVCCCCCCCCYWTCQRGAGLVEQGLRQQPEGFRGALRRPSEAPHSSCHTRLMFIRLLALNRGAGTKRVRFTDTLPHCRALVVITYFTISHLFFVEARPRASVKHTHAHTHTQTAPERTLRNPTS